MTAALVGSTFKQLVQGLCVAMSGRDWAVKGIAFGTLAAITLGAFAMGWILDSGRRIALAWRAIPWLIAAFAAVKLVVAGGLMHRAAARGVFTPTQLLCAAVAVVWDLCVFGAYGVMAIIVPAFLVRPHILLLLAMLAIPFVRIAAAPLALASNRHQ